MRSFLSALIYYAVETYDDWICHFQWDFDDLYMKNSFWSGCGQTICKVWCDDFLNNLYLAELEKKLLTNSLLWVWSFQNVLFSYKQST